MPSDWDPTGDKRQVFIYERRETPWVLYAVAVAGLVSCCGTLVWWWLA